MQNALFAAIAAICLGSDGAPNQSGKLELAPADAVDLTGYYEVSGRELNGSKYAGVMIAKKVNQIHMVRWVMAGGQTFSGIGVIMDGKLAVSWTTPSEKGFLQGINIYSIRHGKNGPTLNGRWATLPGDSQLRQETMIWLKALPEHD